MKILGIDTGAKGALVTINNYEKRNSFDMPMIKGGLLTNTIDYYALENKIYNWSHEYSAAFIEIPAHYGPAAALTKSVQFYHLGLIVAALKQNNYDIYAVKPISWKRYFKIVGKDKVSSAKEVAINIDSEIRVTTRNDVIEAYLIGIYGYENKEDLEKL